MFQILIVEDSSEKLKDILQVIEKIGNINVDNIDCVPDALGAKVKLKEKGYDLLILDIAIPNRKSESVDLEGGLKLLQEIQTRQIYSIPTHIIGLTGKEEIYEEAQKIFESSVLSLIRYSNSDIEWQGKLLEGIKQRIATKESASIVEQAYDFDFAIVCALKKELDANLSNGWKWDLVPNKHDDTIYYRTSFKNSKGEEIKIISAKAERMGMPAAAAISMKVINLFRPRYIAMTGIMAGVSQRVQLGDLVVTSPVWDWGSGKWVSEEESKKQIKKSLFLIDPYQFTVDRKISKEVALLSDDKDYKFKLRNDFGKGAPTHDISILLGPTASGASVLSDKTVFDKIKNQHRNLVGVEMEAYGLFSAAEIAVRPKPLPFCVKSVVDFGDDEKEDDYQDFGCYVSATFTKHLIEKLAE